MVIPDRECFICHKKFTSHFWIITGEGIYSCAGEPCAPMAHRITRELLDGAEELSV